MGGAYSACLPRFQTVEVSILLMINSGLNLPGTA